VRRLVEAIVTLDEGVAVGVWQIGTRQTIFAIDQDKDKSTSSITTSGTVNTRRNPKRCKRLLVGFKLDKRHPIVHVANAESTNKTGS
jgi:hypothetical protein